MTGYAPHEYYADPNISLKLFHADDLPTIREAVLAKKPGTVTLRLHRKDGRVIWLEQRNWPILDQQGNLLAFEGIARDVTQQKTAEAASKLHSTALEATANGVVITDAQGTIQWVNPAFTRMTGYSLDDVQGQNPRLLKSSQHSEAFYQELWHTVGAGQVWHGELINRRKDGSLYSEEQTITPVRNERGEVTHFVAIKQDVSQRVELAKAVEQRERRFKAMIERSHDAVSLVDRDLTIRYASPTTEHVLGYHDSELITARRSDLLHPEDRAMFETALQELSAELGGTRSLIYRFRHKNGSWRWLENRVTNLLDDADVDAFVFNYHDVTQRMEAEAALRESEERFRLLADNAADVIFRYRLKPPLGFDYVSPSVLELTGYTPGELFAEPLTILHCVHPEDQVTVRQAVEDNNFSDPFLLRWTRKDQQVTWIDFRLQPLFGEDGTTIALEGIARDVTEQKRAQDEVRHRALQQRTIAELGQLALRGTNLATLMQAAVERVANILNVELVSVLEHAPTKQVFLLRAAVGWKERDLAYIEPSNHATSQAGFTLLHDDPVVFEDISNTQFNASRLLTRRRVVSGLSVVIDNGSTPYGVLSAHSATRRAFTQDDVIYVQAVANTLAAAIRQRQFEQKLRLSHQQLVNAYDATIEGWAKALDLRDHETEGHSRRVTEMSVMLARAMGLSEDGLVTIRRGALLHDIGKMGVPDSILSKPGALTEDEWILMRAHTTHAYELLSQIPFLEDALDIPYGHHEKFDGTGYPRGLAGNQIPLAARIFAVVDVYDALTSDRPYRKAWPKEKALSYIQEQSGAHFDPGVVAAFCDLLQHSGRQHCELT